MTKYILNLNILHRVVAVIHFLQGLFMTFGGRNIAEQYGWDYSIGFAAMVEHHGSTLVCVSIYFWFLPSFLNLENLKNPPTVIEFVDEVAGNKRSNFANKINCLDYETELKNRVNLKI